MKSPHRPNRRELIAAATGAIVSPSGLAAHSNRDSSYTIIGFTKPFQSMSFDHTADTVAEIGWDGIECPVRPKGQIEPERAPDELPKLVDALKKRGKEVTLLATAITSVSEPHTEKVLRTAAKLGIKRYRLGSPKYDLKKSIANQLDEIAPRLRDLAALNKDLGLQAGFQNHSGVDYVGAPVWDLWTMIKDLDPRHMGVCFDIGHATVEGGSSWPIEARLMQRHFTAIFTKDFYWERTERGWRDKWVPLGDGMVNPSFFRWLKTTDFSGPICIHTEYDHGQGRPMIANMQKDLKVLQSWLST